MRKKNDRKADTKQKGWHILFCLTAALGVALLLLELILLIDDLKLVRLRETIALPGEEGVVIRSGNPESDQIALTCNVDWGEDVLPDMLNVLKEKEVDVTFFVTGQWAEKHPDLVRRMYLEGHSVQSHGYHHVLCGQIDKKTLQQEIQKSEDVIDEILGYRPHIFAPPSGDYNEETVSFCREKGYTLSLWSSDTIDWRPGSTAAVIKERILNKPLSGAIVLMHPKPETVKALPEILDEIKARGIETVPLENFICRAAEKEL